MPDTSSITALEQKTRLLKIINSAKDEVSKQIQLSLEKSLSTTIPSADRQKLIKYAKTLIPYHIFQELKQYPNLDKQEYVQAVETSIEQAILLTKEVRQNFNNLLDSKQEKELIKRIQSVLDPLQAQEIAKAVHQLEKTQTNNTQEQLVNSILEEKSDNFGIENRFDTLAVIKAIEEATLNNPSKETIEKVLDNSQEVLIQNQNLTKFGPNQLHQFCQKIKQKHLPLLINHIQQSTKSLPRQGPFTEGPIITNKTSIQAQHLQVSSIALAHAKAGFTSDNPRLPQHLKSQVSRIHKIVLNPLNPKHKLSLRTHRTILELYPQVFIATNFYYPIYEKHQQVLSQANKFLTKPYSFYQTVNEKYNNFQEKYQKFKQETPLGWLIAPRLRLNLAWFNTKQSVKTKVRTLAFKNKFIRNTFQKTYLVQAINKSLRKKWSFTSIKNRTTRWFIRKTGLTMIKMGVRLAAHTATKGIGAVLITTGTLILESTTIIGIPLAIIHGSFLVAKGFFNKVKKQTQKQKFRQDAAGLAAKVFQTILGGLKALGAFIGGSVFSIGGAILGGIIGFSIGGPLGAVVGVISGSLIGAGIGAFLGWNWMTIAAIPAAIGTLLFGPAGFLSGGLIGAIPAATSNAVAAVGVGALGIPVAQSIYQTNVTSSAFSLPNQPNTTNQSPLQKIIQSTPIIKPEFTINYNSQNSTLIISLQSPYQPAKNQTIEWFKQQGINNLTNLPLEWIEL